MGRERNGRSFSFRGNKRIMKKNILISGFGGQGMVKLGKILAQAALDNHKHISWFPSYGAEMRGGTAHCSVKISDSPISSPLVDFPDIAMIFNQPSLEKFKSSFRKDTLVILNSDFIQNSAQGRLPGSYYSFALNKIALGCGSLRMANIVALGALLSLTGGFLRKEAVIYCLKKNFPEKNKQKQNLKALAEGEKLC